MSKSELISEVKLFEKFVETQHENDIENLVKLGIARRKLYDYNKRRKGILSEILKHGSEVEEFFWEAMKVNENHVQILYNICRVSQRGDNHEKAGKYLELMKLHHPDNPWTIFAEGIKYFHEENFEKGLEYIQKHYEKLKEQKSTHKYAIEKIIVGYKYREDDDNFLKYIEIFEKEFGDISHWGMKELGRYYLRKSREKGIDEETKDKYHDKVEECFTNALKVSTLGTYYQLFMLKRRKNQIDEALELIEKALECDPYDVSALSARIHVLVDHRLNNNNEETLVENEEGAQEGMNKNKYRGVENVTRIILDDCKLLIDVSNTMDSHLKMAFVLEKIEGGDAREAIDFLEGCKEKLKDDEELYKLYFDLSLYYGRIRHISLSLEAIEETIRLKPDFIRAKFVRSQIHWDQFDNESSLRDIDDCIEQNYLADGEVYFRKGRIHEIRRVARHPDENITDLDLDEDREALRCYKMYINYDRDERVKQLRMNFLMNQKRSSYENHHFMILNGLKRITECYGYLRCIGKKYRSLLKTRNYVLERLEEDYNHEDYAKFKESVKLHKLYEWPTKEGTAPPIGYFRVLQEADKKIEDMLENFEYPDLMRDKGFSQDKKDVCERLEYLGGIDNYTTNSMVEIVRIVSVKNRGEESVFSTSIRCHHFLVKWNIIL